MSKGGVLVFNASKSSAFKKTEQLLYSVDLAFGVFLFVRAKRFVTLFPRRFDLSRPRPAVSSLEAGLVLLGHRFVNRLHRLAWCR
jgi:hypothetical protein